MKTQISGFLILCAALVMTGCRYTIEGSLKVDKNFVAKSFQKLPCNGESGGPCEVEKNVQIKVGEYSSKLHFNNRTEMEVQIKGRSTETLKVQIPTNMTIPENGTFAISASQSGQPFNLAGDVVTISENSRLYRERESCMVERWEQECYETPQGRMCRSVLRTYPGFKDVEYYYIDTNQDIEVALTMPTDGSHLALFTGHKTTSEKRYTYQGYCW